MATKKKEEAKDVYILTNIHTMQSVFFGSKDDLISHIDASNIDLKEYILYFGTRSNITKSISID